MQPRRLSIPSQTRAPLALLALIVVGCHAQVRRDPLMEKPWLETPEACATLEEAPIVVGESTFMSRGAKCPVEVPRPNGSSTASGYCSYRRGCGKLWVCSWTTAQREAPIEERQRHDWRSERCKETGTIPGYTPPAGPDWAAEAGSNRWLHSFGPELALSATASAEKKRERCKAFFPGDYYSKLEEVVAANDVDDLGDFLFLLDICSGSLALAPGSDRDLKGFEAGMQDELPRTEREIERMLLLSALYGTVSIHSGTVGGGYYPLTSEHTGRLQLRLLEIRRGTGKKPQDLPKNGKQNAR